MTSARGPRSAPRPRTLTEALRTLTLTELTELLTLRPDLSYPLPQDVTDLSSRATTTTSIGRALDQLDAWLRQVVEALAALPDPSSAADAADLLDADHRVTAAAVADLRKRALLWGADDQLHLVRGVREYFEPYPGGLAPPSPRPLSPEQIRQALADCDAVVQPLLQRLLWSPAGAVRNAERRVDPAEARSAVDQLLARQLLRPLDSDTVILPREVALQLRDGRFSAEPVTATPPLLTGRSREMGLLDKAAAGAAYGLLHDVELAVHSLEETPHRLLRTGGLGARDLSTLARNLASDTAHAGFVMELAAVAGLVASGSNLSLLPTPDYDRWAALDGADQWRVLAAAWLRGGRHYSRSTEAGAHVLGPEADAPSAPVLRTCVLRIAVEAGAGVVLDVEELTGAVGWHYPRAARTAAGLGTLVGWVWREAGWLGLSSLGATSSYAAALLSSDEPLPAPLADLFPAPVDKIVVQADLTAVAPGPLPHTLAGDLRLLADQESRGGGGVYRFSAGSVRRAFEAGWSSDQVHAWLEQHSATPVPQPLAYLIDDMARQYGSIRVGSAVSYVRVQDPAQAAALLSSPDARALGLRTLAPGVLAATAEASDLVEFLRSAGHAPAVEDDTGSTLSAPPQQRAPSPRPALAPQPVSPAEAAQAITAMESRLPQPRPDVPLAAGATGPTTDETVAELQNATQSATAVRVRYVSTDGESCERDLHPLDVTGGLMRAVDADDRVLTIPLARISSASALPEGN